MRTLLNFLRTYGKTDKNTNNSKDTAKERLHLVLMQDRANVSADFLDLMKQEIIEVIKKYIDVDESAIDVRMTNKQNDDGTNGAPALYANIPILSIKEDILRDKNKEKGQNDNKEVNAVTKPKDENTISEVKKEKKEEAKNELEKQEEKIEEKTDAEEKEEPKKEDETKETANKN